MEQEKSVSMSLAFSVKHWAAWAPGIEGESAWRAWADAPTRPCGDQLPGVAQMPAMARRRLGALGRMACECAFAVTEGAAPAPVIFASQYGEISRSLPLFESIAKSESVSPTEFSMSVHNAISGVFSIAAKDAGNHIAVAAGVETAQYAAIEAASLLAEGADEVVLVVYDQGIPVQYAGYVDEAQASFAWACRLAIASDQHRRLCLSLEDNAAEPLPMVPEVSSLPAALAALRAVCGEHTVTQTVGTKRWTWSGHAAHG